MAYAITQSCCADASCVSACPVNCIHPTPDEPDFGTTDMLFIDPATCIDCGACADACPVDAAKPADQLTGPLAAYSERNQAYFAGAAPAAAAPAAGGTGGADGADGAAPSVKTAARAATAALRTRREYPRAVPAAPGSLRVAVVGTGPSAGYTVRELLHCTDADITLIDRNAEPGGLVRFGVAPDHPATKRIGASFARTFRHPRVSMHLGVSVGSDIGHDDLLARHHAVVYATGAGSPRALGIDGEDLPGSLAAMRFLEWANGLPGAAVPSGLTGSSGAGRRAVIIGNGNVAIDVARLLLGGPDRLAATGIAPGALEALRGAAVSEVVLLARRGPGDAAFAPKEFIGLFQLPGLEIVVDGGPGIAGEIAGGGPMSAAALLRAVPVREVDWDRPPAGPPRLVLRFHSTPLAASGDGRVQSVRVSDPGGGSLDIPAGMLIRSIGSRGTPVPGLPFDDATGIIPNSGGRVSPGCYVTGWAKRGAAGGIGANRACARETVGALLDDAEAGTLAAPARGGRLTRSIGRNSPSPAPLHSAS